MNKTFEVPFNGEKYSLTIPDLPEGAILPGAFRADILAMHDMFLGEYPLWAMEQCNQARNEYKEDFEEWATGYYSWNQFLREINLLGDSAALSKANLLFGRDILPEMQGGLLGNLDEKVWMKKFGMPSLSMYYVTLLRAAAREKWWNRVRNNGVPDPLEDPMPPIFQSRNKVQEIYKSKIQKFTNEVLLPRGFTRETEAITAIILYVMGYVADKPQWLGMDYGLWHEAVRAFISPPHSPLLWMLWHPGDYLNHTAEEAGIGKQAGFFSTPMEITTLMAEIVGGHTKFGSVSEGHYVSAEYGWKCNVSGQSSKERIRNISEAFTDPCVGGGNMIWGLINQKVFGEFIDVNHTLVQVSRATCALYAPWLVHSIFHANALTLEIKEEGPKQYQEYVLEQARAEYTLAYYLEEKMEKKIALPSAPMRLPGLEMESKSVSAHIEARGKARLYSSRKAFVRTKTDPLKQLLEQFSPKDVPIVPLPPRREIAESKPISSVRKISDKEEQLSLFGS